MNKAVKAIIAIIVIGGALYYMYGQMKSLGYFSSNTPPAAPAAGAMPGRRPSQAEVPGQTTAPAPSTDTTTTSQ